MKKLTLYLILVALVVPLNRVLLQEDAMMGMNPDRREEFENLRIWKMTEFLDLSSEQSAAFFPKLHNYEKSLRKKHAERNKIIKEIYGNTQKSDYRPSDDDVRKFAAKLAEIERQIVHEKEQFIVGLSNILTPSQQIRYVFFEVQFRERLMQTLNTKEKQFKSNRERRKP